MILADTAFGTVELLHGIRKLKYHAVTGVPLTVNLDGRVLRHLHKQGQQVRLVGLKFPVTVSCITSSVIKASWRNVLFYLLEPLKLPLLVVVSVDGR